MTGKRHNSAHVEINMLEGPILGRMLAFALPLMLSSVLQLLFNAADVIVVGKFAGDRSLAAVGSTSSLISLLTNFFLGLSIGVNVLVARFEGAGDEKAVKETVHTAMITSLASGLLLTGVGLVCGRGILALMSTPAEVIDRAALYLRIYFLGMPAMMIYNFGAAILRSVGDTRRPLNYLFAAGILNVILNLFFVIVLKMDVAGVATATAISQCLSAVLVVRCLMRETGSIRLRLEDLHFVRDKFTRILMIGFPAGLQSTLFSFSNVIIQSTINSFGPVVVAGSAAASNIEGFVYISMNSFYQATLSFTSQNIGAGKYERIGKILRCGLACAFVTGLILGPGAVLNGKHLLDLYTDSPEVIAAGMQRLTMVASCYFLCGMMDTMVGSIRGMGYAVLPMVVSLVGACGLRIVYIFTLFRLDALHTPRGLFVTYPISWAVTLAAHIVCYIMIRRKHFLPES